MMKQVKPLADVIAKYKEGDPFPETLIVNMDNGRSYRYRLDVEHNEPHFIDAMTLLKKLPVYGRPRYRRTQKDPAL